MTAEQKFIPVMITPFDQQGNIDFDGLSNLIDFYLEAGVKGFFANCLSSEMYDLKEEERLSLTRHVVKYVNGRVPVVATGSFGSTIEDKAEFTKKIYQTGIDAVILVTGEFAAVEDHDDLFMQHIDRILNLTGHIPLGLYECPVPYKRVLAPEVLAGLLRSNRFIYYKDTSKSIDAVRDKVNVIQASANKRLELYDAHSPNAALSLQAGANGLSPIAGNFYPEIMVWMCKYAANPSKQEEVQWLQGEMSAADPVVHEAYPVSAKYFLQKRKLPMLTISRTYVPQLTTEQKIALDKLHEKFLGWCDKLSIAPVRGNTR